MYRIAIHQDSLSGKIPTGDPRWSTFNDRFKPKRIEQIDLANDIYTGHAYCAWHKGRRCQENFECGQHIGVDMDTGDARSSFDFLLQHDFIRVYASLLHTTPSHTAIAPHARVVFLLDAPIHDAMAYKAAARFVTSLIPGADAACAEPSRFFYGCKDCEIELLPNVLPLTHLRSYFSRYAHPQASPTHPQPYPQKFQPRTQPIEPTELERLADAMRHVDPYSVDYNGWIGIIAAVKRDVGEPALPLVRQWAQGQEGEIDRIWQQLDRRDRTHNPKHINSLFWLAQQAGWKGDVQH